MFFSNKIKIEGKVNPGDNGFVLIHSSRDMVKGTFNVVTKENVVNLDPADIYEDNSEQAFESNNMQRCNIM